MAVVSKSANVHNLRAIPLLRALTHQFVMRSGWEVIVLDIWDVCVDTPVVRDFAFNYILLYWLRSPLCLLSIKRYLRNSLYECVFLEY